MSRSPPPPPLWWRSGSRSIASASGSPAERSTTSLAAAASWRAQGRPRLHPAAIVHGGNHDHPPASRRSSRSPATYVSMFLFEGGGRGGIYDRSKPVALTS